MSEVPNKEKGRIAGNGMGGFLCPPGHPTHKSCVETDLRRRPENRGSMSLEAAVECEYLDDATKAAARTLLRTWEHNKPALESPEVQEWILQVLGYFKHCFNLTPEKETRWHANNLTIDNALDPMERAECHAGVHLIRKYYPDFQPTAEHFAQAYWGQKPGSEKTAKKPGKRSKP